MNLRRIMCYSILLSIVLVGCGKDSEKVITEHKIKYEVLKKENESLVKRIKNIESDFSERKTIWIQSERNLHNLNQQMLAQIESTIEICRHKKPSNISLDDQLKTILSACNNTSKNLKDILVGIQESNDNTNQSINSVESTTMSQDTTQGDSQTISNQNPNQNPSQNQPVDSSPSDSSQLPKDDSEKQLMLMGAFLACQYYSAGTCAGIMAAVGIKLGMSGEDVRKESTNAWENATEEWRNKEFEIPGPDGETIVIDRHVLQEAHEAKTAYLSMSNKNKKSPCKIIATLSDTKLWKRLRIKDKRFPSFPSRKTKEIAIKFAEKVNASLVLVVKKIPVNGESKMTCR